MNRKRFFHLVFLVLGLSLVGLLFYYTLWLLTDSEMRNELFNGWPFKSWGLLVDYTACCLFTTVVTLYYWRSKERTAKERDRFRLQALENQLSPHFVFNNFSILADLIESNPTLASDYLLNLSKVYRYTLSHLDHNTVSIQEELRFLEHYTALFHQRFGESIQVHIDSDVSHLEGSLPPATLQILIENAIKHNEHTVANPLKVTVATDGRYISVSNPKAPVTSGCSANVGQQNIIERYRLLSREKVIIDPSGTSYIVKVPVLKTVSS